MPSSFTSRAAAVKPPYTSGARTAARTNQNEQQEHHATTATPLKVSLSPIISSDSVAYQAATAYHEWPHPPTSAHTTASDASKAADVAFAHHPTVGDNVGADLHANNIAANEFGDCTHYRMEMMSDKLTEVGLLYEETLQRLLVARDNSRQLQALRDIACASVPEKKFLNLKQNHAELLSKFSSRQRELEDALKRNAELDQRLVVSEQDVRDKQSSCRRLDKQLELKKELFQTREEEYLNEINNLKSKLDDAVSAQSATQTEQIAKHNQQQQTLEHTVKSLTQQVAQLHSELEAAHDKHRLEMHEQLADVADRWRGEVDQREQAATVLRQQYETQTEALTTTQQQLRDQMHVQQAAVRQHEAEKLTLRNQIKQLRAQTLEHRENEQRSLLLRFGGLEKLSKQLQTFADDASTHVLQLDVRFVALDTALSYQRHTLEHALVARQQDFAHLLLRLKSQRYTTLHQRAKAQHEQEQQTDKDFVDNETLRAEIKITKQQLGAEIRRLKRLLEEAQRAVQNPSQATVEQRLDELRQQHLQAIECARREHDDQLKTLTQVEAEQREKVRETGEKEVSYQKTLSEQLKIHLQKAKQDQQIAKNQYDHEIDALKRQTEHFNMRAAELVEQLKTERERHQSTKLTGKKLKQQVDDLRRLNEKNISDPTSSGIKASLLEYTKNDLLLQKSSKTSLTDLHTLHGSITNLSLLTTAAGDSASSVGTTTARSTLLSARRSARRTVSSTTTEVQTDAAGSRLLNSIDVLQRERDECRFLLQLRTNELESVQQQLHAQQHQLQSSAQAIQRSQKQTAALRFSLEEQRARLHSESEAKQSQLRTLLTERELALKSELRQISAAREMRIMTLQAEHEAEKTTLREHYEQKNKQLRDDIERISQQAFNVREAEIATGIRQQREKLEKEFEQRKFVELDEILAKEKQLESHVSKLVKLNQISARDFLQRLQTLTVQLQDRQNELEKLNETLKNLQSNYEQAQNRIVELKKQLEHCRIEHEREVDQLKFEAKREHAFGQQQTRAHYERVLRETLEKFSTSHSLLKNRIETLTEQYQTEHKTRMERERDQHQRLQELDALRGEMGDKEVQMSAMRRSNEALFMNLGLAEHQFNAMFGNVLKPPPLTRAEASSVQLAHYDGGGEGLRGWLNLTPSQSGSAVVINSHGDHHHQRPRIIVPVGPKVVTSATSMVVYNNNSNGKAVYSSNHSASTISTSTSSMQKR